MPNNLEKRSKLGWYISFALFGITLIGATQMSAFRSKEWVTIDLPNPPAPLTYVTDAPVVPAPVAIP